MSRWDAAKFAERSLGLDRVRATVVPPANRRDPVSRPEPANRPEHAASPEPPPRNAPLAGAASTQWRPTPRSEPAPESLRVAPADLSPLARPHGGVIADLSRIEIALTRLGAAKTADATSFEMGAEAVREVVRRMRLVVTAGDALVTTGQ